MTSPMDRLLDAVDWRCTRCGNRPPCGCWTPEAKARRRETALAYIAHLAETCACGAPGGYPVACGCSPVCECHTIDEWTAWERGRDLGLGPSTP